MTGCSIDGAGSIGGQNSVAPEVGPPNNRGEVAGFSDTLTLDPNAENCFAGFFGDFPTPYTCLPFVWRDGVMTALPTLGGNNGVAAAINNRGQVAGTAENATRDPACPFLHFEPVIWEKDQISMQLPTVSGDADGTLMGSTATARQSDGRVLAHRFTQYFGKKERRPTLALSEARC